LLVLAGPSQNKGGFDDFFAKIEDSSPQVGPFEDQDSRSLLISILIHSIRIQKKNHKREKESSSSRSVKGLIKAGLLCPVSSSPLGGSVAVVCFSFPFKFLLYLLSKHTNLRKVTFQSKQSLLHASKQINFHASLVFKFHF
jgi:hypothetical protein